MWNLHGFSGQLLQGACLTLQLAAATAILGGLFGFLLALAKVSHISLLRGIAFGTANVFRALPELLVVLIVYFGVQQGLNALFEGVVRINAFAAGLIALSLIFGAYASEVFRSAYNAVPPGQIEAGWSVGMGPFLVLRRIHLPQLLRLALPSLANLWLILLKDTSLVAVIGLEELMRKAQIATSVTKLPFTFYGAAAVLYIVISVCSSSLFNLVERRHRRGLAVV